MKHLTTLFAVLVMASLVGNNFANAAPRGGKPYKGTEGTVGELAGNKFSLVTTMPTGREGETKTFIVQCDNNTKFLSGGQPVDPSTLKPGVHVAVLGGQNGNMIMANTVNIGDAGSRK
jgi:hypothetical protein